jgi:putative Holliday junction resolvase
MNLPIYVFVVFFAHGTWLIAHGFNMRYLGIDYGLKRTGLALCDAGENITTPLVVIDQPGQVIPKILEVIKSEQVEAVVIGLPLNAVDGSEGPQARATRKFAVELSKHISVPLSFQDERFSSFEAEQKLAAADFTRKRKKQRLDAIAAAEILQSFLDEKHRNELGLQ